MITTLERGGAQRILWNLIQNKSDSHIEHIVICLSEKASYSSSLLENNISVFHLNGMHIFQTPIVFLKLIRLIKTLKPNLIQTWLYHSDLLISIAKLFFLIRRYPVIWSIHHASTSLKKESFHTKLSVILLSILSHFIPKEIIYCSDLAFNVHHKFGYRRHSSTVINNSVDSDIFKPNKHYRIALRNELKLSDDDFLVGLIARNDPNKGLDLFLQMAELLNRYSPKFKFLICGQNMEYSNIKNTFDRPLRIESSSLYALGEIENIEHILNALDILICPSLTESFGLIALESLCTGTPVVCSDIYAFRQFITDDFIVKKYSPLEFARTVKQFFGQDKQSLFAQIQNLNLSLSSKYSLESMTKKYYLLYKQFALTTD